MYFKCVLCCFNSKTELTTQSNYSNLYINSWWARMGMRYHLHSHARTRVRVDVLLISRAKVHQLLLNSPWCIGILLKTNLTDYILATLLRTMNLMTAKCWINLQTLCIFDVIYTNRMRNAEQPNVNKMSKLAYIWYKSSKINCCSEITVYKQQFQFDEDHWMLLYADETQRYDDKSYCLLLYDACHSNSRTFKLRETFLDLEFFFQWS